MSGDNLTRYFSTVNAVEVSDSGEVFVESFAFLLFFAGWRSSNTYLLKSMAAGLSNGLIELSGTGEWNGLRIDATPSVGGLVTGSFLFNSRIHKEYIVTTVMKSGKNDTSCRTHRGLEYARRNIGDCLCRTIPQIEIVKIGNTGAIRFEKKCRVTRHPCRFPVDTEWGRQASDLSLIDGSAIDAVLLKRPVHDRSGKGGIAM